MSPIWLLRRVFSTVSSSPFLQKNPKWLVVDINIFVKNVQLIKGKTTNTV